MYEKPAPEAVFVFIKISYKILVLLSFQGDQSIRAIRICKEISIQSHYFRCIPQEHALSFRTLRKLIIKEKTLHRGKNEK